VLAIAFTLQGCGSSGGSATTTTTTSGHQAFGGDGEGFGKDTYAMSHPFAFKDFMEKYLPTAEFTIEENSTSTCNEWVKLCIDDGHMESCNGPTGNDFQLHSVGAYMRDPGTKSMEQIETEFTQSMGDMTKYDPYFEYHMAFLTEDLDSYVSTFDSDKVPYFASTWTDPSTKKAYKSILFQVPGSLGTNAKSLLNIAILCSSSSILEARTDLHFHFSPRAFPEALAAGHARLASAPRKLSSSGKPVLVKMHRSFASSDVSRDSTYFESAMQGTKLYDATSMMRRSMQGSCKAVMLLDSGMQRPPQRLRVQHRLPSGRLTRSLFIRNVLTLPKIKASIALRTTMLEKISLVVPPLTHMSRARWPRDTHTVSTRDCRGTCTSSTCMGQMAGAYR